MKFMKLFSLFYSKYFFKELMIMIEIIVLILAFNIAVAPVSYVISEKRSVDRELLFDAEELLYFSPNAYYLEQYMQSREVTERLNNEFENNKNIDMICKMQTSGVTLTTVDGESATFSATMNFISQDTLKCIDMGLSFPENGGSELPVYVSSNLGKSLQIGDRFKLKEISDIHSGMNVDISCRVSGILDDNYSFISLSDRNSIFHYQIDGDENYIIAQYKEDLLPAISWFPFFIIKTNQTDRFDEIENELNQMSGKYGTFESMESVLDNEIKWNLSNHKWSIMMMFLSLLVLLFGYGGYLIFTMFNKRNLYTLLNICGAGKDKILAINLLYSSTVVLPAVFAALLLTPIYFNRYTTWGFMGYDAITVLFIVILICYCFLLPIIFTKVQTKNNYFKNAYSLDE